MLGDHVIVREYGNRPVLCRVWEVTSDKIWIVAEEDFERLKSLKGANLPENCFPVGFPKSEVFVFNSELYKEVLDKYQEDPSVWDKLTVYQE